MKTEVIPVLVGALGTIKKGMKDMKEGYDRKHRESITES